MTRSAMFLGCLLFVLILATPPATAFLGTEDLPELPDGVDDVSYQTPPFGDPSQRFLDIIAAWWEYDDATDGLTFTAKLREASDVESLPRGWYVRWLFEGTMTRDGEQVGFFGFDTVRQPDGTLTSQVYSGNVTRIRTNDIDDHWKPIAHTFEPAWEDPQAQSTSILNPGATALCPCGPANTDDAASKALYSFTALHQLRAPDGALDPVERFETETPAASHPSTDADDTATLPFVVVAACLATLALLFRRRSST